MSISEFDLDGCSADAASAQGAENTPTHDPRKSSAMPLQRLGEVRREQGVSIRRAAQLMGKSVEHVRLEEQPHADLTLTQIYEWQRLLEVPVADLLVEPHAPLSAPVLRRAQMLRLMKTVQAIMEKSSQPSIRRLAQTMINQLVEIMPELEGVSPWHAFDPRTQNPNGRILEQTYLHGLPAQSAAEEPRD